MDLANCFVVGSFRSWILHLGYVMGSYGSWILLSSFAVESCGSWILFLATAHVCFVRVLTRVLLDSDFSD